MSKVFHFQHQNPVWDTYSPVRYYIGATQSLELITNP